MVGAILRFSISAIHTYSSDELSAINRLNYSNFNDLIEFGVKTGDMHPAGVQFFEKFWSNLFGTKEWVLRFPFVLMGTFSVYLTYTIGKKWMSLQVGLIAATILSITYFPIVHSELARPYSPGLLFSLLSAYFWLNLLKNTQISSKSKWLNSIGLALSFAAGMYTHYFAFLFLGWMGISGLFYLKRQTVLPYLLSGILACVLFLPHLSITVYHLSIDGGLQWLGKPDIWWLFHFIFYAFNNSIIFLITLILVFIVSKKQKEQHSVKQPFFKRPSFIFALWFFGIYVIGYAYSFWGTPVLKYPVMLFPLPFLFLWMGSWFNHITLKQTLIASSILLIVGTWSTIVQKDLYGNRHFGVFKELVEPMIRWRKTYGANNLRIYMNVSNPNYLNYYAIPMGDSLTFNRDMMGFDEDISIRQELLNAKEPYCVVGYSAV